MPASIAAELGADRVADLLAGVDDRLADRQAGAQGAHHQVDRLGEQVDKRGNPPVSHAADDVVGQGAPERAPDQQARHQPEAKP